MKKLILSITAIFFLTLSCQKENNLFGISSEQDIELSKASNETNELLSGARTHNRRCNAGFTLQNTSPIRVIVRSPLPDTVVNHYWTFGDGSPVSTTQIAGHLYAFGTYTITHIVTRPTAPSCSDTARITVTVPFRRLRTIVVRSIHLHSYPNLP